MTNTLHRYFNNLTVLLTILFNLHKKYITNLLKWLIWCGVLTLYGNLSARQAGNVTVAYEDVWVVVSKISSISGLKRK